VEFNSEFYENFFISINISEPKFFEKFANPMKRDRNFDGTDNRLGSESYGLVRQRVFSYEGRAQVSETIIKILEVLLGFLKNNPFRPTTSRYKPETMTLNPLAEYI
jgi:hypothetical protein